MCALFCPDLSTFSLSAVSQNMAKCDRQSLLRFFIQGDLRVALSYLYVCRLFLWWTWQACCAKHITAWSGLLAKGQFFLELRFH